MTNFGPTIGVGNVDEDAGYDVVGGHLCVVFPPLFKIDSKNLLQPERELDEIIPFQLAGDLA